MPNKLDTETKTLRVHVNTTGSQVAKIHAWRKTQDVPPSLSGAIRALLDQALEAASSRKGSKHAR